MARKRNAKAVFFDRDGTLNFDPGYISDPGQFEVLPGVPEALRTIQDLGFLLVVVSNQSGVGRGLISLAELSAVHTKLDGILSAAGVKITYYALCFHHPDEACECRKPKPKMVLDAARLFGIDLTQSYMVGDKAIDVECGRAAGVRESFLVRTGNGEKEMTTLDSQVSVLHDLAALAKHLTHLDNG